MARIYLGNVKGPKGDTGATGATGPQGEAATIEVGAVTTTEYGRAAQVTNVGSASAAKFDFVIPQGKPGEKTTKMGGLTLDEITASMDSFPSPGVGDTGATAFGKIVKFFSDALASLTNKIDVSKIANDFTTTDPSYVAAAPTVKALNNSLVSSITASGTTITYKNRAGTPLGTFTTQDTNTWRGIQNNLTSTSTTDSLSAYQGKVLSDRTAPLISVDRCEITSGVISANAEQSFGTPGRTGVWYVSGISSGSPTGSAVWGMLFQMRSPNSMHSTAATAMYTQLFISHDGYAWTRALNNNSWTAWRKCN